jgi:hypothetical protein
MDRIDEALGELGEGLPFAVDWESFERQTLERLQASQRRERRRVAFAATLGLFSGVAATVALMLNLSVPGEPPLAHKQPAAEPPPPGAAALPERAPVKIPEPAQPAPVHRMVRNSDGTMGRMVFYGFSPDSSTGTASAISIRRAQ